MAYDYNVFDISPATVPTTYYAICICGTDGAPLVSIRGDGTIEYGPNYDPDETAKAFWQAMTHHRPYDPKTLPSTPYQDPSDQFWETERPA